MIFAASMSQCFDSDRTWDFYHFTDNEKLNKNVRIKKIENIFNNLYKSESAVPLGESPIKF